MTKTNCKNANILIIDDNPGNLKLLTKMLSEQGYRVRISPSAKLGIDSVMTELPDLIILDIKMPEMDGYEVCEQLKVNQKTQDIPIIFVTGLEDAIDKVKAFQVGAVDYIVKPFKIIEVIARVENQLQISQKIRELQQAREHSI